VALATCSELPDLDEDERLVVPALEARGVDVHVEVWDDPSVQWETYELVVVRSTWDYHDRRDDFLRWAASAPRVLNPLASLVWNTDKTYLRELSARGIPCVATTWMEPGTDSEALELPGGEVVIKPAISAGSNNTERFAGARDAAASAHLRRLLDERRTVMVQPYVASVDRIGEIALLYVDGELSHAVRKAATLLQPGASQGRLFAPEEITRAHPSHREVDAAESVLDVLQWGRSELLYARVDLVNGDNSEPLLLEVELTEPSMYLGYADGAADRFATAIAARL